MVSSPDVIVIGGGVIGTSIAYHLARVGIKVMLLERGRIGGQASNAATGVLTSPLMASGDPYSRLASESLAMFHALAPELKETGGVDIELVQCGEIGLALDEPQAAEYQALARRVAGQGGTARWLDHQELHELEPEINPSIPGGFYQPEVCRVNNQRLSEAFARAAVALGAEVRQSSEALDLIRSGPKIDGVRLQDEELYAGCTVIAAGSWSKAIAGWVGGDIPVRPVRGVNLNLQPLGRSIRSVIHGSWGLMAPRSDGSIIAGATVEEAGFDARVTSGAIRDILDISTQLVPSLQNATLNWSVVGLRPGSPDDAPLLGPVPGLDSLLIASGHYRNGILLCAITGKLIADHISGKEPELLAYFSPRRFKPS